MSLHDISYAEIKAKMDTEYNTLIKIIQCNCVHCDINKDINFKSLINYLNKVIYYGYYINSNKRLCKNIETIIKISVYLSEKQCINTFEHYKILCNKCLGICYKNEDMDDVVDII